MSDALPPTQAAEDTAQLTQARVPLHEAALAFTVRDEYGRLPIVVVPERVITIQNPLLLLALAIVGGSWLGSGILEAVWLMPLAISIALVLIVLALYRSFIVRIPEGANGLLAQGGRYLRTIGPGTHYVLPYIAVSHLVTRREIPYDVPVVEATTRDNVRALVDTLLTFSIVEPFLFVYKISADDFDQVLRASCQDALRTLTRGITSQEVLDLQRADASTLQQAIGKDVEPYGVGVNRVVVTSAKPPEAYMHSLEERQLAMIQRAEQTERQLLALQRQADAGELVAQQVASDAASEALRLQRLEERILQSPSAAQYDLERARLEVARALAGNNRTLLHIGGVGDLAQPVQFEGLLSAGRLAIGDGRLSGDEQTP